MRADCDIMECNLQMSTVGDTDNHTQKKQPKMPLTICCVTSVLYYFSNHSNSTFKHLPINHLSIIVGAFTQKTRNKYYHFKQTVTFGSNYFTINYWWIGNIFKTQPAYFTFCLNQHMENFCLAAMVKFGNIDEKFIYLSPISYFTCYIYESIFLTVNSPSTLFLWCTYSAGHVLYQEPIIL